MAREPRTSPILPSYGESSLADLSSSVLAALTGDPAGNVLGLPETGRACLLIIDGLGLELLRAHQAAAPFLAELAFNSRPLTAGFPSTTVTSLGSLGTGLPPAAHGMLGYQVAIPGTGKLLNGLNWPKDVDPVEWQPRPTIFERAFAAGVSATYVAPRSYQKSGLSMAALRGPQFKGAPLGTLAALTAEALAESDAALVAAYHGDLDSTGHVYGVASQAWVFQLSHVNRLVEQLASALPRGPRSTSPPTTAWSTSAPTTRSTWSEGPAAVLREGVALLGGEPRARHVYTAPGAAADVLATWREVLGEHAWVASREEAVKDGWFGPPGVIDEGMAARIGDVVAACAGTSAVIASKAEPLQSSLFGMHGSLTAAEQLVPMLAFAAQ